MANSTALSGYWPYLYILIAGWLATDIWRWLGVLIGNRLLEDSLWLIWVRAVATALVAAIISRLILFPLGALADTPVSLRVLAVAIGFLAFLAFRQRVIVGILVSEAVLFGGVWVLSNG